MQETKKPKFMDNTNQTNFFYYIPSDVIKIIISFHEALQWFLIDKRLCSIAKEAIDPENYKKKYNIKLTVELNDNTPKFIKQFNVDVLSVGQLAFYNGLIAYALCNKKENTYEIYCARLSTNVLLWKKDLPFNQKGISLFCFKPRVGFLFSTSESTTVTIIHTKLGNELSTIELPVSTKNPIFLMGMDGYLLYRAEHTMYGIKIQEDLSSKLEWYHDTYIGATYGHGTYFMYHVNVCPTVIIPMNSKLKIDLGIIWKAAFGNDSLIYVIKNEKAPNKLDVCLLNDICKPITIMSIQLDMEKPEFIGISSSGICVLLSGSQLYFVDVKRNTIALCETPMHKYGTWYFDRERTIVWHWDSVYRTIWKHKIAESKHTGYMYVESENTGRMAGGQNTKLLYVDKGESLYIKP